MGSDRDFPQSKTVRARPDDLPETARGLNPAGKRADLFRIGELVGHFEIRSVIGAGAMGQVFEAHDLALNRRVAIKAPWPGHADALRSEAQALAPIRHPALITVYHLGEHRGLDYVVMERIYGVSMSEHLLKRQRAGQIWQISEALELLAALAEGLSVVHRSGIAHRDVKPENVMLAPGNRVILMDFGLSKAELQGPDLSISGSPPYMAPETITGTVERGGGFLVDVYALGCMAYELIAGELPFDGASIADILEKHVRAPRPDLAAARDGVPPKLATLVGSMLSLDPAERPQNMDAVAWALRDAAREEHARATDAFHVLVVDDDEKIAKLLSHWAKKAAPDAQVAIANDAETALARFHEHAPDLLFLDLHMPRMNGIEVCMYLRGTSLADRTQIVSVSAGAQHHDIQLLHQLGITEFVPKDENLSKKVQEIVKRVRAR